MKRSVFLVGLSGSGKTTVGRLLAERLGARFVDTDVDIERTTGRRIPDIFAADGEAAFRELERRTIREVIEAGPAVVSTGGGAPVDDDSRRAMHAAGLTIWLDAPTEVLVQRLAALGTEERPLLAGDGGPAATLDRLRAERRFAYAEADLRVDTADLAPERVVAMIAADLEQLTGIDTVWVQAPSRTYPVYVGRGVLDLAGRLLSKHALGGTLRIIADERVAELHGERLRRGLSDADQRWYPVPAGEEHKTLDQAHRLYDALLGDKPERGDTIVAFGGGVIGDLAGFVAATLLRGMPFVQAPTTVLSQVDSSVGGKVGVDHPAGKNLIGAFHQPSLVLADLDVLRTLPPREVAAGWAEVVKVAVVQDARLFEELERSAEALAGLDPDAARSAIRHAIALKARLVEQDEHDTKGIRAVLNYGHTIGHAIETASEYAGFLHGEAVAIGMAGAAYIAERLGLHPADAVERQSRLLRTLGLPQACPDLSRERVESGISLDKKRAQGRTVWILPRGIGQVIVTADVPDVLVDEALELIGAERE
jgi:shikimate kinase / 3-dehydroquinate synthase